MEKRNTLDFFLGFFITWTILIFFFALSVKSQTPEIDSLNRVYTAAYHLYDSCFKASEKYILSKDCTGFWDNQAIIRAALRKCATIDEIIDHKRTLWFFDRSKEIEREKERQSKKIKKS